MGRYIIHFEDGQDFLRWTCLHGVVLQSSGQGWVWNGTKILKPPIVGEKIWIKPPKAEACEIKHRVKRIEEEPDMVVCSECGAETADPGRGVRCEETNDFEDRCGGEFLKLRTWKTRADKDLRLELNESEAAVFDEAARLYTEKAERGRFLELQMRPALFIGRTGAEAAASPLFQALRDMSNRRGVEDGTLADVPGSRPSLSEYEVNRGPKN
jgi:hypothetical protein